MRAVGKDNPFNPDFKVPPEYLKELNPITNEPGKLTVDQINEKGFPISGKFSKIGEEILKIGSYKAKWMSTGNW
jgi:hypothetical protein